MYADANLLITETIATFIGSDSNFAVMIQL